MIAKGENGIGGAFVGTTEVEKAYVGDSLVMYKHTTPVIRKVFSTVGVNTFTIPKGVTKIDVFLVGSGGGSGQWLNWGDSPGGSGSGGGTNTILDIPVKQGDVLTFNVGEGVYYSNGNSTTMQINSDSTIYTAVGGNCGLNSVSGLTDYEAYYLLGTSPVHGSTSYKNSGVFAAKSSTTSSTVTILNRDNETLGTFSDSTYYGNNPYVIYGGVPEFWEEGNLLHAAGGVTGSNLKNLTDFAEGSGETTKVSSYYPSNYPYYGGGGYGGGAPGDTYFIKDSQDYRSGSGVAIIRYTQTLYDIDEDNESYYVVFDENSNMSTFNSMETGGNIAVRDSLRAKFKRGVVKNNPNVSGEAEIAYYSDTNSELWPDGTALTGNAIDYGKNAQRMVHFPKYYYRNEDLGNGKYRFRIAESKLNDYYKEERECLVGMFCGVSVVQPQKTYLISTCKYNGLSINGSKLNMPNAYLYATNMGTGWGMIDYRVHKTIANMYCIMYGTTNINDSDNNIPCSGGTKHPLYGYAGSTLSLGNADGRTTDSYGTYSTSFLGIEDTYNTQEFLQGANFTYDSTAKTAAVILYDGGYFVGNTEQLLATAGASNIRTVTTLPYYGGYITSTVQGEYSDVLPDSYSSGSNNYYKRAYWQHSEYSSMVLSRGSITKPSLFSISADSATSETMYSRPCFYGSIKVVSRSSFM